MFRRFNGIAADNAKAALLRDGTVVVQPEWIVIVLTYDLQPRVLKVEKWHRPEVRRQRRRDPIHGQVCCRSGPTKRLNPAAAG